jgi:UDP-glucose 4-epimerase
MQNPILITGHHGWIGSNFTQLLDEQNIAWVGLDRVDDDYLGQDMSQFYNKIKLCDVVVHLAATPRIPDSWANADRYRENNVGLTDRIARICAEYNKHLVFASSSSVYGNGSGPLNPYSWTKLAGEQSIEMYGRSQGLNYTIARIFTNYGGKNAGKLVISNWLDCYARGAPLILRGTGQQTRDFIHVSDTAQALLAICQQLPCQKTLDIGTGNSVSLLELLEIFEWEYTQETELIGYADRTCADLTRTQNYLDWTPKIDVKKWIKNKLLEIVNTGINTVS